MNKNERIPFEARFWSKVSVPSPRACWEWQATVTPEGYGKFTDGRARANLLAHRVAYERLVGPIPDGLQLDHLCRNRRCVNPSHLEPVTVGENIRRGLPFRDWSSAATRKRKTHCKHGHEFTALNTYTDSRGHRACQECAARRNRERQARRRAVA